jgi:hypothetical protein
MKTPDQERLLADVLLDESHQAFQAELRQTMLAEVRRVRRYRRMKPLLALAACVPFAFAVHWLLQGPAPQTVPARSGIASVRSVPLRPEQIVTTAKATRNYAVVSSRAAEPDLAIVSTVTLPDTGLTDEQLLELVKDRAVALVSLEGGKKLVFLDDEGTKP